MVLVGAQAVHMYVPEAVTRVVDYTTDGDLGINPQMLSGRPDLDSAMRAGGFEPAKDPKGNPMPGAWQSKPLPGAPKGVVVDLLVPTGLSKNPAWRAARIDGQVTGAARYARGIEAALVDNTKQRVAALEDADKRLFEISIAGPAALLIAKLIKLGERVGTTRQDDKDAFEIFRLLQQPVEAVVAGWRKAESAPLSRDVAAEAKGLLARLFAEDRSPGAEIAGKYVRGSDDPDIVTQSARTLARELLRASEANTGE